jgi:hypothetical protein
VRLTGSLATANFVDVILHTRVPVGRLVDWVDQPHLYLLWTAWRILTFRPDVAGVSAGVLEPAAGLARVPV